jgi:hypothetical protein
MNTEIKTLQTEVFEAMGETSMCWEPIPAGVFQSTNAERIGNELMAKIESNVPNAIKALVKALKEDGSYYYSWQANIAMAFYDEWKRNDKEGYCKDQHLHVVANKAAMNFLDLLCAP